MIRSLLLLVLLGFIWGSGYAIARYATTHGVLPLGYAFWQSFGPALVLLLLTIRHWYNKFAILWRYWPYYFVAGVLGLFIPNTNMYFAAPHLPAGVLAVIVNIVPLLVYPLALFAKQERLDYWRIAGVLCGVLGIMLIIFSKTSLPSHVMTIWAIMTLMTPLSFALSVVYIAKYRPPHVDSLVLSTGMLWVSAIVLIPIVHGSGQFYSWHFPLRMVDWLVILEILLSSCGYVLFFKLINMTGPVYYSLVSGVVALTGLFWGRVIFHESLHAVMVVAVTLILLAIAVVTWRQRQTQ